MDKVDELLTRGVDKIYPSKEALEKVLRSGKKLKLYQGFDPTGTQLHIGHITGIRKLAQFQALGHHVIFLIGDGTGQAGDPSGKMRSRNSFFNQAELRKNAQDYVKQAGKIVDFGGENPVKILFNGDWLNKLTLTGILDLANHFSVQQLLERDMFQERIKRNESINLREFLYPLLQGYDSVEMEVDLELGGSDQTFNMLVGRRLLKEFKDKDKFVMTTPLLTDSEGRKIGKTEGNVIAITDSPNELYGKIMNLSDDVIIKAFEYLTDVSMEKIREIDQAMQKGENPIIYKKQLAFEIVNQLHEEQASPSQEYFESVIQKKETPTTGIPKLVWEKTQTSTATVADGIKALNLASSGSEIRRVTEQGGTVVSGKTITNPHQPLKPFFSSGGTITIQFGKRKFGTIDEK